MLAITLSEAVPGVPIYCRRFKGNCKRSTNLCCKYLNASSSGSSTTTPSTTTTTATTAPYEEEYVDELEASDGDPLDAQPSYVEEVFVKPTLEELNLVSEDPEETSEGTADANTQYAPRFCSILKFNCATRSSHPCCKNPLQPDVSSRRSSSSLFSTPNSFSSPARRKKEEQLEEQEEAEAEEKELTKENDSESEKVNDSGLNKKEEAKNKLSKPTKSKYSFRSKSRSLFGKKPAYQTKTTRRPKPTKSTPATSTSSTTLTPVKKKPSSGGLKGKIKSSFFNRRPSGFDPSKSALCRIVNCGRTPQHKCCARKEEAIEPQAVEVTTTTETPRTPETTPESSTFGVSSPVANRRPEEIAEDVTEGLDIATAAPELNAETKTNVTVEETTEHAEEASGGEKDQEVVSTTSMYGMYGVEEETTTLQNDEVSTSVDGELLDKEGKEEEEEEGGSGETEAATGSPVEGSGNEETRNESGLESGEATLAPLEIMHELSTEAVGGTDSPQELTTLPPGGISSEGAETLQSFLATYTTSVPTVVTPRVIAPVYIPPWAQAKAEREKTLETSTPTAMVYTEIKEGAPAMVYQDIEESAQPIQIFASNDLEQLNTEKREVAIEVDPEMEAEGWKDCRQFDCLLSPDHPCCDPHKSDKRHIEEGEEGESWRTGSGPKVTVLSLPGFNSLVAPLVLEYPGRVTATVTRVEKSYSWSPWRRL